MNDSVYYILAAPSTLPLLYTVSILCFLAGWQECGWTSMTKPIMFTLTLPVLSYALVVSICEGDSMSSIPWLLITPLILIDIASFILLRKVYLRYVEGPDPFEGMAYSDRVKLMSGKVVMITGANAGIGKETAEQLLSAGATVIFACRSESKARAAMENIAITHEKWKPSSSSPLLSNMQADPVDSIRNRMIFLELDLSNLDSVRKAVKTFEGMNKKLNVLINNAGVMMGEYKETEDKFELTIQANHLGHFLLTTMLLPTLRKSAQECSGARVITVSSSTHNLAKQMFVDDLNCEKRSYSLFGQYAQSKLANIMFASELARREKQIALQSDSPPVLSVSLHPGLVRTDVVRNMPIFLKLGNIAFGFLLRTLQKAPYAGAYTSVFCTISNNLELKNGLYFSNSAVTNTSVVATEEHVARALWHKSETLIAPPMEK